MTEKTTAVAFLAPESHLSDRIKEIVGDESQTSFAKRCGVSESVFRKYLAGAMPSTDRLVAIAEAGGVTVEWLATGREPKLRRDLVAALRATAAGTARATAILTEAAARHTGQSAPALDEAKLQEAIYATELALHETGRVMDAGKKAHFVQALYQLLQQQGEAADAGTTRAQVVQLIKLVA